MLVTLHSFRALLPFHITLVEKWRKKNRNRYPIAVLLTTLICSHITTTKFYFSFCDCKIKCFGACDILLERCFQDISNVVLRAPT